MTIRALSIVVLAVAGLLMTAIVTALGVSLTRAIGWPTGIWLAPAILFASTTITFFFGRHYVLPRHLAATPRRALAAITVWNTVALLVTIVAVVTIQRAPDIGGIGGVAILMVWFFSILAFGALLTDRRRGYSH